MSGGVEEHVAAFLDNGHANLTTNASSLINPANARFVDVYRVSSVRDDHRDNYIENANVFGNAGWETSTESGSTSGAWHGSFQFVGGSGVILTRGSTSSAMAGNISLFASFRHAGHAVNNTGYRIMVVP